MKQPVLGFVATGLIMVLSWAIIWALGVTLFMGWASYVIIAAVPFALVVGVFWKSGRPTALAALPQPIKGLGYLAISVVVAAIVAVSHYLWRGGGQATPPPMIVMAIISSVTVAFFLTIALGCWPFTLLPNKLAGGVALLVTAYLVNLAMTERLFNFEFAKGAPFYRPELDPGGAFNAWSAVNVITCALAVLFIFLLFDMWPVSAFPALQRQPVFGLVVTAVCIVAGWAIAWFGTSVLDMPAPTFMVKVAITYLFGAIVLLNMFGGAPFSGLAQPLRGVANFITAGVIGWTLAALYQAVMPLLSGPLPAGPEGDFAAEVWLANALLAVTFPIMAWWGDFFGQWPFVRSNAAPAGELQPANA